jgi:ATP-dependent DNA ligase
MDASLTHIVQNICLPRDHFKRVDSEPGMNMEGRARDELYPTVPAVPCREASGGSNWIHEIKHDGYRELPSP